MSELQVSICLCLPSSGVRARRCCHAWLLYVGSPDQIQFLIFTWQELDQLSRLLIPEGGTSLSKGERPGVQGKDPSVSSAKGS